MFIKFLVVYIAVTATAADDISINGWNNEQVDENQNWNHRHYRKRNVLTDVSKYWPNGIVYYNVTEYFNNSDRSWVLSILHTYEKVSCIRFKQRTDEINYVEFRRNISGCGTYGFGMKGGKQFVNLGRDCDKRNFLHLLGHLLGLRHEHQSFLRDNYVTIHEENIVPGKYSLDFEKLSDKVITNFGIAYDYESIMHDDAYKFSKNGLPTITTVDPKAFQIIGKSARLSKKDVSKLWIMYECYKSRKVIN